MKWISYQLDDSTAGKLDDRLFILLASIIIHFKKNKMFRLFSSLISLFFLDSEILFLDIWQ